ncbi:hypothetical protein BCD48_14135 [Pseudofrankia sp. BMG5.36]|nr:hypothetical protein BCD48_14135 [Pseudofrankia sp. BMG5.36]
MAVRLGWNTAGWDARGEADSVSMPPGRTLVVGRGAECDLRVPGGQVSRRHLRLVASNEGWTAVDVSRNGTWHAGERVRRVEIRAECRLRLGAADGPEIVVTPLALPAAARPPVPPVPRASSVASPVRLDPGAVSPGELAALTVPGLLLCRLEPGPGRARRRPGRSR